LSGYRAKRESDEHLAWPQEFWGSKKLDKAFLNEKKLDPISLLEKLNRDFGIGAPIPVLKIRPAKPAGPGELARAAKIVVRNTWDGNDKSTHVSAEGLTEKQAEKHLTARAALHEHARETILRFQVRLAPTSIRYSRILAWFEAKRARERASAKRTPEAVQAAKNGVFAPSETDNRDRLHNDAWLAFLGERTLLSHTENVGDDFNTWFRERLKKRERLKELERLKKGEAYEA
jgi:hypothetical protein